MKRIKTIVRKEWAEVFKNRMVIFTVAFLPLIMTALPLGILYATRTSMVLENAAQTEIPRELVTAMCPEPLNSGECFQVYMVSQFMLLFMMLPLAIPVTIASYSIVGEKATRSLEPLLATPISTLELLIGKSLSATLPAVFATYAAFGVFAIGAWILVPNREILASFFDARWLVAIFVVGPLMAAMSVTAALMVSSRVNDPRAAEQISMMVILPLLAVFFGQMAGLFVISLPLVLTAVVVLLALDALMFVLAVNLFQREVILTRWK